MNVPPDMLQSLKDFADWTSLPARIGTPFGRMIDLGVDFYNFVTGTPAEQWGIGIGFAMGKGMEYVTAPLKVPAVTEAVSSIYGKIAESAGQATAQTTLNEPKKP